MAKEPRTIRVTNSQIHATKKEGLNAVGIGLLDADGNKRLGSIFVGDKSVNADKNTANLPDSQKKSYVALSPDKAYDFVSGFGENRTKESILGADIITQNKAYMKDLNEQRTQKMEADVQKDAPEAEAEAEMA